MTHRIAVVTDIHHGTPVQTKRSDMGLPLLTEFAAFANDARPDCVLELGDRISDVDHDTDLVLEREVADAARAIEAPVHHFNGNHDRDFISVAENEAILGQTLNHRVLDTGDWQILLWRADTRIRRTAAGMAFHLPEADLLWLSRALMAADRPVLIASHVPLAAVPMTGNYYFEANPGIAAYPLAQRIRAVLAQCRQPVVSLAGHVHWTTVRCIDGTWHLTQQSLTESYSTGGEPAGSMGLLELGAHGRVHWRVLGREPFEARFTASAGRWMPPLARFADHADPAPDPGP